MRMPADLPRRRPNVGSRGRVTLVVLAFALFVLLTSLRGIAGFYTDFLWFDSLGYRGVFTGVLGAKITLAVIFSAGFFVLLWLNLLIADRLAPRMRPAGPEEEVIERYHELIGNRTGLVRLGVSLVFGFIAGVGVSGKWHDWLLFRNAQDFGVDDPQFGMDAGFYVFKLPFLTFVVDWLFASLIIILLITAAAHYVNGGIRVQGSAQRVTPQVKGHLSVLLGVLAAVRAVGYYLQRYELTLSNRGTVDGATYTDVNAQLPALNLLIFISAVAVLLFIVNIWRRGWVLPVLAVGLWAFVALVVGGIYPWFVQRVQVEPAESSKEAPFIERNIEATRIALGLAEVDSEDFASDSTLTGNDLLQNAETVRNIRLWDPRVLLRAYQRLQEVRPYYRIRDVDVDRYEVEGETTQVLVSARELNTGGVPQESWEARHLTYTHGHGLVMAPANSKTSSGGPELLMRDVPVSDRAAIGVDEAGIYFGEGLSGYTIIDTNRQEIDVQDQERTIFRNYDGEDGVGIGSIVRRLAFSLRFGDINPLISGNIRDASRILYIRDVKARAETVAPFLSFDADPYPVLVDGDLKWVIDAYTTTSRFPYAQRAERGQLPPGSGIDHNFNYIRNSVKAVVDAYDGTTTLYVVDDTDPLLRAYRAAFPDIFTDGDEVPDGLRAHFRYPEDLFRVQTNMWGRYHISDADDFYNLNDAWNVAQDPGTAGVAGTQPVDENGEPVGPAREARLDPYYLLMRLPGEEAEEFLMLRPFVPVSADDSRKELTAFMTAGSDPEQYGTLRQFVMPRGSLPAGPGIAGASIAANETVAELETLLGQEGSDVLFGNLVLIPIEQSLLYVQPLYVESTQTRIPELRKVIVYYDDQVTVSDTLQEALAAVFGESPETGESTEGDDEVDPGEDDTADDVLELLNRAVAAFQEADEALAEGDLGTYQEKNEEGQELVERAQQQSAPSTTTTTAPPDADEPEADEPEAD